MDVLAGRFAVTTSVNVVPADSHCKILSLRRFVAMKWIDNCLLPNGLELESISLMRLPSVQMNEASSVFSNKKWLITNCQDDARALGRAPQAEDAKG